MVQKIKLINEDGTFLEDFPQNPLQEKWSKLYPPYPNPEYDDYTCMQCSKCPFGGEWVVPEEDIEVWNNYQQEILNYHEIHNPKLYENMTSKQRVKTKTTNNL